MDSVAEIKSRLSIEELVGQYVQLKKAGRHLRGLCPFHKERTPSFSVSPERQMAYCFGCHKGGDIFSFIQEIEGLDFRGALEFLAERTNVTLPKSAPHQYERKSERDRLIAIHDDAVAYYKGQLWETPDGERVLAYLKKRGLNEEMIRSASLGFAPEKGDALYSFLLEKDYTRDEIFSAGLAFARSTDQGFGEGALDRFRMRLLFPIANLAGKICAFGGRAVREGDEPKYLNSPETPVYKKNSLLFALDRARGEIKTKNQAVIVEGYMDALSAHQAGYKNVVACSGTALTLEQLAIIKRFTKEVVFAFDRDNAGKMATNRAIELGFEQELNMKVVVWEGSAKDPDECLRQDPQLFAQAIEKAQSARDYLLQSLQVTCNVNMIEGKKEFIQTLLPFFARVKSPLELDEWVKQAALILGSSASILYDELKRFTGKQKTSFVKPQNSALESPSIQVKIFSVHEYLIGLLLTYPEIRSKAILLLRAEEFEENQLQNIYRSLSSEYNQNSENQALSQEDQTRANILGMYVESRLGDMPWEAVEREVLETIRSAIRQRYDREKRTILTKLKHGVGPEREHLLESYQELLSQEEKLNI
ncbi:MAG: DNA primase [Patescibacteria group bacterium]